MTHESSSRKRGFALEGKSEVPRVQAAAFRKEGRPGGVQGEGTGNLALLSWLSLVVVDWRKGLPGRRPAERCQGGGGGRNLAQGANDQGQMGGMKMRSFAASTLSRLQPRMDARERERERERERAFGDFCLE